MNVQRLEWRLTDRIDRAMSNNAETVENRIQNAILTAIDNIIIPRIEIAVRSIIVFSGWDAASVPAISGCVKHIGKTAWLENLSDRINTFHEINVNDEIRENFPDEVDKFSVPRTLFDWQSHTHHNTTCTLIIFEDHDRFSPTRICQYRKHKKPRQFRRSMFPDKQRSIWVRGQD